MLIDEILEKAKKWDMVKEVADYAGERQCNKDCFLNGECTGFICTHASHLVDTLEGENI